MRTIIFLVQKEFLQIFRDKAMLFIIFAVPLVQLVVLSYAATFELKNTTFHLVDFDQSSASARLAQKFEATGYFELAGRSFEVEEGIESILRHESNMVMVIPRHFERDVLQGQPVQLQLIINAVDGSTAGLIQSYSQAIIRDYPADINPFITHAGTNSRTGLMHLITSNWYNPQLDYITYMVPGIITVLITLIVLLLSVLNIVREREIGTIEQLNVTPIRKYQFIAGKLIPTWLLAMVVLTAALLVARFWFEVPFRGNIGYIYFTAAIYLLGIQGLGLLISNVADTQQQAMFINFFFFMIFMLMGGIFTPIESMPEWAQEVTKLNPIAYFGGIIRMVLLKGSGWEDIRHMAGVITLFGFALLPLAAYFYKKRVA